MKEAVSQLPENPEALADTPVQEQAPASEAKEAAPAEPSVPPVRLFSFSRLDSVIHASHFLAEMYDGPNTLYKDEAENMYILTLAQESIRLLILTGSVICSPSMVHRNRVVVYHLHFWKNTVI